MATVHLVHGFIGVGKTTLAKLLERNLPAIRFSHDEWMVRFYGTNPPVHLFEGHSRAVTEQVDLLWSRCLELGVDVVLDLGFWSRKQREQARARAKARGAGVVLYRVNCPDQVARARLTLRNKELDGNLLITDATYDVLRSRFEPLAPDEERREVDGEALPFIPPA